MVNLMGYSVLVDNTEQARKLQEIAIKQGFEWEHGDEKIRHLDEKSFQFGYKGKKIITYYFRKNHYQDEYITKKAHFNDLFKAETLQEKEQRLLKELEEVRKKIEEQNKPKVGDWCKFWDDDTDEFLIGKFKNKFLGVYTSSGRTFLNCEKITNPQLIELLENEMK